MASPDAFAQAARVLGMRVSHADPGPLILSLGTDGFGRSDTREALRSFFEIDPPSIAAAALVALSRCDGLSERKAAKAIRELGINPDAIDPLSV